MSPTEALSGADALLRDLTGLSMPFGGKVVVFAGDFRQVLPVMPRAERAEIVAHTLSQHAHWKQGKVKQFHLTGNHRVHGVRTTFVSRGTKE